MIIDIEALRKAAEAALHTGEWYNAGYGTVHDGEHDEVAHPCDSSAVAHIVAAQPRAIIALLDALAAEKRKTLELSRVYEERGRQIERLELRNSRAEAAAGAVPEGVVDDALAKVGELGTVGAMKWLAARIAAAPPAQAPLVTPEEIAELLRMSDSVSVDTLRKGMRLAIKALTEIANAPPAAAPSEPVAKKPNAMLLCGKCDKDRLTEGCQRIDCEFVGTALGAALATPPAQDAGTGAIVEAARKLVEYYPTRLDGMYCEGEPVGRNLIALVANSGRTE